MKFFRSIAALVALAGLVPTIALADDVPDIATLSRMFSPAEMPQGATPHNESIVFQPAAIDTAFLATLNAGEWFAVNASPTRTFAAKVETIRHRGEGRFTIEGRLDGQEESMFVIAVEHDAVSGMFESPATREHYKTKYTGDAGIHLVCQINPSKYKPCGGAEPAPPVALGAPWLDPVPDAHDGEVFPEPPAEPPAGDDNPFDGRGTCSAPITVFDGMIAYSDNTRVALGGANAVAAEIELTTSVTNQVYSRSGIAARYRIVWTGEVNYSETGNSSTDLSQLGDGGDGVLDGLHTTRDSVNADFCTLWVNALDACGRAYCTVDRDSGYSVVAWSCAAGNFSHPHEIGHNQGCDHNTEDGGSGCGEYSYSNGHRFFANSTGYRTVMSYNNAAEDYTRIGYFSNPNLTYLGQPLGTSTRDNTRTINNTRGTCAGYELTRMDIWVDVGFVGSQNGTFNNPYAAVSTGVTQIDVPSAGRSEDPNLYIKAGTSTYTGTISKVMWIKACGGTVNIGGNP
jgi:hypothetical protein